MSDAFFRFPQIPHIAWLGSGSARDDKLLSPQEVAELLSDSVVVEEKLDGANLGLSVGPDKRLRAQNRGQYLVEPYGGQFQRLGEWIATNGELLSAVLGEHLIAFGEWCAARHSLDYPRLPDWWLLFDIYDRREGRFWSTRRRDELAARARLAIVPRLAQGRQSLYSLERLVIAQPSRYRDGPIEGLMVRREDEDWLLARGKLVRADFVQGIRAHWRSRRIQWNQVRRA